ncbi:MAG: O-antigen ligase family protein [Hellea sp.]
MKKINKAVSLIIIYITLTITPWINGLQDEKTQLLFTALLITTAIISIISSETKYKKHILLFLLFIIWNVFRNYTEIEKLATISKSNSEATIIIMTMYFSLYIIITTCIVNKAEIINLIKAIVISAAINSIYSLVNYYTSGAFVIVDAIEPWDVNWDQAVRGTLSYKNQYATYLVISFILCLAIIKDNVNSKINKVVYISLAILIGYTITKTSSRGAIIILGLVLILFFLRTVPTNKKEIIMEKTIKLALLITIIPLFLMSTDIGKRLEDTGLNPNGRNYLYQTAINVIINENYIFGNGAGTYPVIQQKYKNMNLGYDKTSNHAHNDYLEFAANYGTIGYLFVFFGLYLIYIEKRKEIIKHGSKNLNTLNEYSKMILAYLIIHSAIDYNMGLPLIVFLTILTIHIHIVSKNRVENV